MSSEIKCSLCKAPGVNKSTCSLNPESTAAEKHVAFKSTLKATASAFVMKSPRVKTYEKRAQDYYRSLIEQGKQAEEQTNETALYLLLEGKNRDNLKPIINKFKKSIKYANLATTSFYSILVECLTAKHPFLMHNRNTYAIRLDVTKTITGNWVDPASYTLNVLSTLHGKLLNDDVIIHLPIIKFYLRDQPALDAGGVSRTIFNKMAEYFKSQFYKQDHIYYPCLKTGETINRETTQALSTLIVMSLISNNVIDLPLPLELFELIVSNIQAKLKDHSPLNFNFNLEKLMHLMNVKYPKYANLLLNFIAMDETEEHIPGHFQSVQGPDDKGPIGYQGRILPIDYDDESLKLLNADKYQWYHDVLMRNLYYVNFNYATLQYDVSPLGRVYIEIAEHVAELVLKLPTLRDCIFKMSKQFSYKVFAHHFNSSSNLTAEQMFQLVENMIIPPGNNVKEFMIRFIKNSSPDKWKTFIKYITGTVDPFAIITVKSGKAGSIPTASTCDKSITIDLGNTKYEIFEHKLNMALENEDGTFDFS